MSEGMKAIENRVFMDANGHPVEIEVKYRNGQYIVHEDHGDWIVTHDPSFVRMIPGFMVNPCFEKLSVAIEWCDALADLGSIEFQHRDGGMYFADQSQYDAVSSLWFGFVEKHGGVRAL